MLSDPLLRRFQAMLEGHYVVERELGRGGMATVYLARDLRHDRHVAIKLLQPELTTAVTAERFLREIQITAKLQHPHILTLIDSGAADGLVYYVMPQVEGESLRERLIWEKQLHIDQAIQVARQVASALQYAHERGVIHRDIKPENILLSAGHAMLADFGIARAVRESGHQVITAVGLPLGTPAYMSPEQAAGRDDIDQRTDLYSLGCVMYEMLTGRPPFVGPSVSKVIQAHLTETPPPVCTLCSGAPERLDEIVARTLAKDPADRFQTAAELSDALGFVQAVETLERATPSGSGERRRITPMGPSRTPPAGLGRTPVGLKQLLIVAGLLGLAVLGVLGVRSWSAASHRTAVPPAPGAAGVPRPAPFITSIGVKPLDAIGEDSAARVLSAGLTEEITAQLSKIRQLKVISRTTMEAVRDKGWTSATIADSLGVRYLLEGSVQRNARDLAVTIQLVDAVTDAHVWSDSYRRTLRDILMIRQEIGMKVAVALAGQVPGLQVTGPEAGSANPVAVEAHARGLELQLHANEDDLDEAIRSYQQALELDPNYAQAAAGLATSLRLYVNLGFSTKREPFATMADAMRWSRRAVALGPDVAIAWASRGAVRLYAGEPPESALADLDRAVALAPGNGEVRVLRGVVLARLRRYEEALKELDVAMALDPLNASIRGGGVSLTALGARQYEVAAREAHLAATRDPGFWGWRAIEGIAYLLNGQPDRCLDLSLGDGPARAVRAMCLFKAGREAEAGALVDTVEASAASGSEPLYSYGLLGAYRAQRGDVQGTLSWLERGFAKSPTAFDFRFFDTGLFDAVRDDPAFRQGLAAIVARVRARFGAG